MTKEHEPSTIIDKEAYSSISTAESALICIMNNNRTVHFPSTFRKQAYAISLVLLCLQQISAFQLPTTSQPRSALCVASLAKEDTIDSLFDVDDDTDDDDAPTIIVEKRMSPGASRWANLNPAIKARIIKEGQEKAIRNKEKREPKDAKKRREFLLVLCCTLHCQITCFYFF
jgi:hypothetical protein